MHWTIILSLVFNTMTTACSIAALASTDWINNYDVTVGLWRTCTFGKCTLKDVLMNSEMVTLVFLSFAIIFASSNCFITSISFCFAKEVKRTLMTLLSYVCCVCLVISASVYTAYKLTEYNEWSFGWGFVVTWCSVGFSILAALGAQVKKTPSSSA